jgi:hypothetical protein
VRSWQVPVGPHHRPGELRQFAYGVESTDAGLLLFLLPGGRPRRLAGTGAIQAGGLPRRTDAASAAPARAGSALRSHPCVAVSSAQGKVDGCS